MTARTDIGRFHEAQANGEYEAALAEITAGRKRGHWIWYVFPQVAGLGQSHMSQLYAIRDRREAEEYLQDPLLSQRLLEISQAAASHLKQGVPLTTLMGSSIDAGKLASSMTLFAEVARGVPGADAIVEAAEAILEAAAQQGYQRCEFTLRKMRSSA
jgi:uncharacterized protein (DUF1810 family)